MNTRNEHINVEKKNELGFITLAKPDGLNLLDSKMLHELEGSLNELGKDERIQVIVLNGNKNFSAGANIKEMKDFTQEDAKTFSELGHRVFNLIEHMDQPVIASVSGYALGAGCELALACDIRIAGEKARFGQPEVNLGLIPGFGGTQRLTRLVGTGRAKEMILTGKIIEAKEALAVGIINKIVEDEELAAKTREMAEIILQKGQVAVRMAKKLINKNQEIKTGLEMEIDYFSKCFATRDHLEGITAFMKKRKPEFKGK